MGVSVSLYTVQVNLANFDTSSGLQSYQAFESSRGYLHKRNK